MFITTWDIQNFGDAIYFFNFQFCNQSSSFATSWHSLCNRYWCLLYRLFIKYQQVLFPITCLVALELKY